MTLILVEAYPLGSYYQTIKQQLLTKSIMNTALDRALWREKKMPQSPWLQKAKMKKKQKAEMNKMNTSFNTTCEKE